VHAGSSWQSADEVARRRGLCQKPLVNGFAPDARCNQVLSKLPRALSGQACWANTLSASGFRAAPPGRTPWLRNVGGYFKD